MSSFFNKAKEMLGSSGSSSSHSTTTNTTGAPQQKDDYVDKGFAAISKQFGFKGSKEQNERITDAGRSFYEKQTGKKVSSNVCISWSLRCCLTTG